MSPANASNSNASTVAEETPLENLEELGWVVNKQHRRKHAAQTEDMDVDGDAARPAGQDPKVWYFNYL
jgi:U3 small nucleolar RNA-associated protein 11